MLSQIIVTHCVPDSVPMPCIEALLDIESVTCAKAPKALETRNIAQS
jgi:hypothetical protein